jgi:hypothetical protein
MFSGMVHSIRIAFLGSAMTAVSLYQSAPEGISKVLSNREARKAASYIEEATVPSGLNTTAFTVRISVGADGEVKNVSNPYSLPDPLFVAASDAARQWRFSSNGTGDKPHAFEADITFHGPITGRVAGRDGAPVAKVIVSGSEWKCCPVQRDIVKTDDSGSFRLEHPGRVLHFLPGDGFQPQSSVVTPEMSTLNVTLDQATSSLSLRTCVEPQHGFERIGWGKYGLQFDAPQREVRLIRGKVDVDYVVHIVKTKRGDDRVEFWFGPYAMTSTPDDEQFIESETFAIRTVVMAQGLVRCSEGGVIGGDFTGRLPNGNRWRHMAVLGDGVRYRDVNPENSDLFDRIIDSACWIPIRIVNEGR